MHRSVVFALVITALAAHGAAQAQTGSPQSQQPTAPAPPKANPPTQPPPPTGGRWAWVPDQPAPPAQPPMTALQPVQFQPVQQPYQIVQAPQQAVYAVQQPVQAQYQTITARPPTTIQLGGGLFSTALTTAGQTLISIGSKRHTWTIQHTVILPSQAIGLAAPVTTYATSYQVNQPVQTVYQPVGVPAPPQQPCPNPSVHEAAPPVPHPSAQSQGGSGPRRIGLLDGLFPGR